ncbi:MAG: HD domain-containing protein [Ruminococcus sp.]|nr:HD domain-containing protein [Ruminococcus sp.]
MINKLFISMADYFKGDQKRINHFVKVHSFAKLIGETENIDEKSLFILECASLTHDIGIKKGEELYNRNDGKIQEQLGPKEAEIMMKNLDFQQDVIDRVMFLIANHHTYKSIESIDLQILVEADFLVNTCEDNLSRETAVKLGEKVFKTNTGKQLLKNLF